MLYQEESRPLLYVEEHRSHCARGCSLGCVQGGTDSPGSRAGLELAGSSNQALVTLKKPVARVAGESSRAESSRTLANSELSESTREQLKELADRHGPEHPPLQGLIGCRKAHSCRSTTRFESQTKCRAQMNTASVLLNR